MKRKSTHSIKNQRIIHQDENYLREELYALTKKDDTIFDFLQNNALEGMWYWDLEHPDNIWLNPRFWEVLGYDPNEMPHSRKAWQTIIDRNSVELATENIKSYLESDKTLYSQVIKYTHKNGSPVWIRCLGMAIRDGNGKAIRMLGIHSDISKNLENELKIKKIESELTTSKEQVENLEMYYSQIFNRSRDGYVINRATGEIIDSNQAYLNMLGYTNKDEINWQTLTPEKWLKWELETHGKDLIERGHTDIYEKEYIRKDGKLIPVQIQAFLLNDPDHFEDAIIAAFVRDISVMKKVQSDLMEAKNSAENNEMKFKALVETTNDMIWEVDVDGTFTYVSPKVKNLLGYNQNEVIGKTAFDLMDKEEAARVNEEYSRYVNNKASFSSLENVNLHKDGHAIIIESSGSPIIDSNGELLGYRGIDRDITDKKEAENALLQKNREYELLNENLSEANTLLLQKKEEFANREELLRLINNASVDQIYAYDLENRFIMANRTLCDDLGLSTEDIIGKTYRDLGFPETLCQLWDEWHKETYRKGHVLKEAETPMPDGSTQYFEVNLSVIKDLDEKPIGITGVNRNITEVKSAENALIKEKEKAEKANQAKTEFLSNMSHEIRTPMNAINGFIQMLIMEEDDEEKLGFLNIVQESSNHLLSILNDILSLSKIESGMYTLNKVEICILDKLVSVIKIFRHQAELKGLSFRYHISSDLHNPICIDYNSVLKIIINLLSNAIKFTTIGTVSISIHSINNKQLEICVEDTGIGINEDKQKHLFEAFEQGEHYLTKQYGGTGLGLAIIKNLTDLLLGTIDVETEEGKGTKIRVLIPYDEVVDFSIKTEIKGSRKLTNTHLKIISAEDVEVNQMLMENLLKNQCASFKKVYNGKDLIDELAINDYDLILMDIQMPILNGIEATEMIKSNPRYESIPIIAISAYAFSENIAEMEKAGVNDYLSKPFEPEEFIEKIELWSNKIR